MKLKAITYDSKNSTWEDNKEYNHLFLLVQERYIRDLLRTRGYIYLNQIYELVGAKWNPDDDNPCFKYDGVNLKKLIEFELFDQEDNSILIHILYHE